MDEVTATLIATSVSTAVSSLVAWRVAHSTNRSGARQSLTEEITKIIDIGMEYPFVEDDEICDKWPEWKRSADDRMRYENFCCYIFNVMEHVWEYCDGAELKIRMILHVEELIWRHRCWWQNEPENKKAYRLGFQKFVERVISKRNKEHAT